MIKKLPEKNRWCVLLFVLIFAAQLAVCGWIGFHRQYLFCDEVYSYGLANSEDYTFLLPKRSWVSGDYFTNYMKFNTEKTFSYKAAFKNQAEDVHPPFYYMLVHTVSSFFPNYTYGPVPGIVLNLLLLLPLNLLLFYVATWFSKDARYGLATMILWGFCAAGISNIIFIRMYLLQTLELLLFVAYHIYMAKRFMTKEGNKVVNANIPHNNDCAVKNFRWSISSRLALVLIVTLGGLTHYYFYFFVLAFGGLICLHLLLNKKIWAMFQYGFTLVTGLVLALAIFPDTLYHTIGYRGFYTTAHLKGFDTQRFLTYFDWINKSQFGGIFFLLLALLVFVIGRNIWQSGKFKKKPLLLKHHLLLFTSLAGYTFFLFVAIQGSSLKSPRYIYPAFPFMSIFIIWTLQRFYFFLTDRARLITVLGCCVALCLGSINLYGIDWTYPGYQAKACKKLAGADCLAITDSGWNDYYEECNFLPAMDEVGFLNRNDTRYTRDLLSKRKTKKQPVLVSFFSENFSDAITRKSILDDIVKYTDYSHYKLVYSYQSYVYQLIC